MVFQALKLQTRFINLQWRWGSGWPHPWWVRSFAVQPSPGDSWMNTFQNMKPKLSEKYKCGQSRVKCFVCRLVAGTHFIQRWPNYALVCKQLNREWTTNMFPGIFPSTLTLHVTVGRVCRYLVLPHGGFPLCLASFQMELWARQGSKGWEGELVINQESLQDGEEVRGVVEVLCCHLPPVVILKTCKQHESQFPYL